MVFLTLLFYDTVIARHACYAILWEVSYQGNNEKDGILGNEAVMTEDM